jgi:type II secretory ATPase GspE/PulE/Tfp pilus assembly ATPase PilB-like protein
MTSINLETLKHYDIIVLEESDDTILFGKTDISNIDSLQTDLSFATGKSIRFKQIASSDIESRLSSLTHSIDQKENVQIFSGSNDNIEVLVKQALALRSSDIHIEKYEDRARIRFRIDGQLVERYSIPIELYPSVINKIKIRASLDIAEKRLPQDGRIRLLDEFSSLDIRVSSTPAVYGEKIVMRLLNNSDTFFTLDQIGFSKPQLELFKKNIDKPNGMVLISGPTGSGKTTTLYAALSELNKITKNIITIEDPVEYTIAGINQVQLKENIGFTYGSALRSFLRQDPDIIMIGEIRDGDTAEMVVRASLTGHMVLSTIHTNSAFGIIARLIDIGVQPFMLSETINLVIAQRLIRKTCTHCAEEVSLTESVASKYGITTQRIGSGCKQCYHTGYSGRKAIYEMIEIDEEIKSIIQSGNVNLKDYSKKEDVVFLKDAALKLVKNGTTSLIEVENLLY